MSSSSFRSVAPPSDQSAFSAVERRLAIALYMHVTFQDASYLDFSTIADIMSSYCGKDLFTGFPEILQPVDYNHQGEEAWTRLAWRVYKRWLDPLDGWLECAIETERMLTLPEVRGEDWDCYGCLKG